MTLHVCQGGRRDAGTLLLIHGTAASLRTWDPLVPLLTGTHHVVRVDLLGCGRSPVPEGASYALPDQARLVGAELDRIGVEHATVVGHSSGGAFATALAEERPELVTALALVNTGPSMDAFTGQDAVVGPVSPADDEQIRALLSSAFRPGFEVPQTMVNDFRGVDLGVFAATSAAIRAYVEERALPERLAPLGKPQLILFGDEDQRWRPSSADDYRTVPGAVIEMLPGLGHSPNIEDPARTAESLLAFTARLGRV
jgi:pimeloyl-ACP methyl ester carboxylesterase